MKLVADLHIHSHFSRATSKNLTFEQLTRWAQMKGIHVVGTGDIAHPGWLQEMRDKLEPAEEGLFRLKDEYAATVQSQVPPACQGLVRFVLGGEISNIYRRDERTRKVHNLVFAPDLAAVERLQARLEEIGNIRADGRPILGLDSRDLLEIVLEVDPHCCLIPAHIWTPWFSLLGSKSGFDCVEACYGDLTHHIFALETGLSSDPPMNWRVSALDRYTLVSNSDAHSPEKLGRETTLFDCELAYPALFGALKTGDPGRLDGTVEFFPEEGKYHFDGHRACGIVWDPAVTLAHGGICPICGKEVTVGVMHRVETLADRPIGARPERARPFVSLVPLPEVLGEVYGVGAGSRQVEAEYLKLLRRLGPELAIMRVVPIEDIAAAGGVRLAEGIERMRRGDVTAEAGYDGEYGVIHVLASRSGGSSPGQIGLFEASAGEKAGGAAAERGAHEAPAVYENPPVPPLPGRPQTDAEARRGGRRARPDAAAAGSRTPEDLFGSSAAGSPLPQMLAGLNPQQQAAVLCTNAPLVIVAGPGTGKTRTLTVRIAYLVLHQGVAPESILAITFTNKAAEEMAARLAVLLGPAVAGRVTIKTFHAFGAMLLRVHAARLGFSPDFVLCTEEDGQALLRQARPDLRPEEMERTLAQISAAKNRLLAPDAAGLEPSEQAAPQFRAAYRAYEHALAAGSALDFDDLLLKTVLLLESQPGVLAAVQGRYHWISVDEYQDVNLAQYRLLRLLSGGNANLCVIGDPDQAIYGFRGAERRYFLAFQTDYPAARTLHLSQNYRSTQLILDAAVQVISPGGEAGGGGDPDGGRLQAAQVLADFAGEVKLDVHCAPTDRAEAEYIVHQIEQMVGGTSYFSLDSGRVGASNPAARSFADFAVLYRLGAQSRLLIEAFDRSGIPYQTVGQAPLYAHKVVREALAYLWLLQNPGSRLHLETTLTAGRTALAPRAAAEVQEWVERTQGDFPDALAAAAAKVKLAPAPRQRLLALAGFWRELAAGRAGQPVAGLVARVAQFIEPGPQDAVRLDQLRLRAVSYGNRLSDWLEATLLQSETDVYDPRADRVTLMTLHAAKGLEFPVVFIAGCEEGLLPYVRAGTEPDVDEERRLFYVGMTRARQKLVLTHARTRFLFGQRMENAASRFLGDIAAALKEVQEMQRRPAKKPENPQLSLF